MIKQSLLKIREMGIRYWATAFIVFILTITGSPYIYDYLHLTDLRSKYFQLLIDWGPRPVDPKFVRIVLVEDDVYWRDQPWTTAEDGVSKTLAGRRPIKRDYLAALVGKLAKANVKVIALDFDARLPDPNSNKIPEEYRGETKLLIQAITSAAKSGIKVVLSTPLWVNDQAEYVIDPDIYQASGLCKSGVRDVPDAENQAIQKNVTCGYISLPDDPLVVPLQIRLADGGLLNSFALAISRAIRSDYVCKLLRRVGTSTQYGNYISDEKFTKSNSTFSAHSVLQPETNNDELHGGAVIVGGHWSTFAAGRGDSIDVHWTPVGPIVGAVLQASFVEAILDDRMFGVSPAWFLHGTEIILSVIAAVAFALIASFWGKLSGVLSILLMLLFIQWSVLHLFGVFFDAFVPITGLGLHALYERLAGGDPANQTKHRKKTCESQ